MPVYELRCARGHRFEVLQPFSAPLPPCACGAASAKVPSAFGVSGQAVLPPPAERMPQTWRGTYGGDRAYLRELRRTAEQRRDLEARHPELAGDRRPIIAHEGRYEGAPLRAGDAAASGAAPTAGAAGAGGTAGGQGDGGHGGHGHPDGAHGGHGGHGHAQGAHGGGGAAASDAPGAP